MSDLVVRKETFSLTPKSLEEAMSYSKLLADSDFVPKEFRGKPGNVLCAVQFGAELGLSPMQALQNVCLINGKPSIYGDAALALVRGYAQCEDVVETVEGDGDNRVAVCVAKRKGCEDVVSRFGVQEAKRANLWGKVGPWTQYPARMLQLRARGFALRDAFPDVLKGLITAEEASDYSVKEIKVVASPSTVVRVDAQEDLFFELENASCEADMVELASKVAALNLDKDTQEYLDYRQSYLKNHARVKAL